MRTAHEFALEGFAFPYGDVALLNSQLVVAQRAVRGRAEHRRVPRNPGHARRTAHREDAGGRRCLSGADRGVRRASSMARPDRLNSAAAQKVIAPDFLLDKTLNQIRLARSGNVADWSLVTSLAKRTKDMPGDFAARAAKIAADKVAPALDRQIAELEAHRKQRDRRCRRLEAAARRRVLRLDAARGHDDAHDARRNPPARPGRTARAAVRDGRHPEEAGSHAGHRRRAHDRARQAGALPLRRKRRRPRQS